MKHFKLLVLLSLLLISNNLLAQEKTQAYFSKTVMGSFIEVTDQVKDLMMEQGFGLLTEIQMDAKLKEKLPDIDMKNYTILGFCNPSYAFKTYQIEENIGILLPCKTVIKDLGNGKCEVVIANPAIIATVLDEPRLLPIASEVANKFKLVLKGLE